MSTSYTRNNLKQPKRLYFYSLIFTMVGLAYYGMKLVLLLFLAENRKHGGLGLSPEEASSILSSFLAWAYLSPVIGGRISDRFLGPKNCISIGLLMISIGYFLGYISETKSSIYLMIFISGLGIGFYKANLHTIVGDLYDNDDPRKDSAFSITYMATNLGTLFGPLLCGLVANTWFAQKKGSVINVYGYKYVFLFSSLIAILGFFVFIFGQKLFLKDDIKRKRKLDNKSKEKEQLKYKKELASKQLTKKERERIIVILILAFFTVFFWIAYNQASMSIALYTKEHIDLSIGNFEIPTSWIDSYNGLLCVILGPLSAALWIKLSKRKKGDLSVPNKMGIGFIFLAFAFIFMIIAVMKTGTSSNSTVKASVIFVIGFLTFQSIGEIFFSPVGYCMVNKLSPKKYISLLMGIWFLGKFAANKLSGYIQIIASKFGLLQVFIIIPIILFILGCALFFMNKKLVKLSQEE